MDKSSLGRRNEIAGRRIITAAKALAVRFDLDGEVIDGLTVQAQDKDVRALKEREAVADLLERLVETMPAAAEPVVSEPEEVIPALAGVDTPPVEPAQEETVEAPEKPRRGKGK
jgi:hypothetical protein